MAVSESMLSTRKNCLNNSSSKQTYSFSNLPRFKYSTTHLTQNIQPRNSFTCFDLKKGSSFSKLKRKLVFQHEKERSRTPSPVVYLSKSHFDDDKQRKTGFSMGEKLLRQKKNVETLPSPASYQECIK